MSTTIGNRPAPTLQRATPSTAAATTASATSQTSTPVKPTWVSGKSQAAAKQQALVEAYGNANASRLADVVATANGLESPQTAMNAMANAFASQGRAGVDAMVNAAMQKLEAQKPRESQKSIDAGFQSATEASTKDKVIALAVGATVGTATGLLFGPVTGAGVGAMIVGSATSGGMIRHARKVTAAEVTGVMDQAIAQLSSTGKVDGLSTEAKHALATEFKAGFEKVSREHPDLITTDATMAFLQQMSRLK